MLSFLLPFQLVCRLSGEIYQHLAEDAALDDAGTAYHLNERLHLVTVHVLDAHLQLLVNRYLHICFLLKASR